MISAIIMGLTIGAAVGAVIGGTVAGVTAYNNGARGWELFGWTTLGIVGGGILGGAIGAGIAAALPTISSFLSSTFCFGNFINAGGELVAVTVTGAQIAAAGLAALAGMGIMFSSTNRPGDNRKQNEQYREAMRRLGYSKEDWQWRYGHDHLPNESLGFKDLLKFLEDLFSKFK